MTDPRADFLHRALSGVPGYQLLSADNPLVFDTAQGRYSAHISSIHDSGAGRSNPDEERIQIPRYVSDIQRARVTEGITPLFIGFSPDGEVFTAWDAEYVFSHNQENYGTVYDRQSHDQLARDHGVKLRSFHAKNLGRRSTTISAPTIALHNYIQVAGHIHAAKNDEEAYKLLYG